MNEALINIQRGLSVLTVDVQDGFVGPGGAGAEQGETTTGTTTGTGTPSNYSTNETQPEAGLFSWWWILIYAAIFAGMYFLMIRPRRKQEKKMKELQQGLKAGDNVVTNAGLFGRITDVGTDCFVVEMGVAGRTVKVPVLKSEVLGVRDPVLTPPPREEVK